MNFYFLLENNYIRILKGHGRGTMPYLELILANAFQNTKLVKKRFFKIQNHSQKRFNKIQNRYCPRI